MFCFHVIIWFSHMACCCCSVIKSCLTLCDTINSSMPIFPVLHYLQELARTYVHWVGDANQASHSHCPLLLLPSVFPNIRVFSNELAVCIRWPKFWSFTFRISPSNGYSGLIYFRIDWFDLLAFQGILNSLIQHHHLKASVLSIQPPLWSKSHICTWLLEKPKLWLYRPLLAKWCLCFFIVCLGLSYLFF